VVTVVGVEVGATIVCMGDGTSEDVVGVAVGSCPYPKVVGLSEIALSELEVWFKPFWFVASLVNSPWESAPLLVYSLWKEGSLSELPE
jgi:hypothetical protein